MHLSSKARKSLRSRLRRRAQFLTLLLGAVSAGNSLLAQSYWVPTASASWQVATNWSTNAAGGGTGLAPSATSAAIFSITGNPGATGTNTLSVFLGGNRVTSGITLLAGNGNINIQANQTGTTVRNLSLGAGGITVNAGAGALTNTAITTSGLTNTLLLESQTWTNFGASGITWNSRLIGHETTTFTKAGTTTIVLSGDNAGINQSVNGATVTGLRGKIVIAQGALAAGNNNALGIRDAQTTATSSAGLLAGLVSDTQVQSGGTLNLNGQATANEFVSFQGTGNAGIGAIINSAGNTTSQTSSLTQALMTGDATVGGNTRFAFGQLTVPTPGVSRFFQDGFTLTKTGGGVVAFVNNEIIGGGNIEIRQGTLSIEGSTNLQDASGATPSAGTGSINLIAGQLNFNSISGSITRPINHTGGSIQHNSNDTIGNVASPINSTANLNISVTDDNNVFNQRGTLNLTGGFTSASTITKQNSGVLNLNLDGATYTGSLITVSGGQFNLLTGATPISANITLASGSSGAGIQRPTIGGEGATTGTLTFGTVASRSNIVVFDGNTTGANQHLRVGSVTLPAGGANSVEARLAGPTAAGTGIVVLESTVTTHGLTNELFFNGRGTLDTASNPNQVLLNYAGAGNIVWRGNDGTNPTFFDLKTSTNWDNVGSPDQFFDGDAVTFDDTVGAGSTTVALQGINVPGNVTFNNGTATYILDHVGLGNILAAGTSTLVKNGTGTTVIRNGVGTNSSAFGATTINAGVLEIVYNNPGLASSAAAVGTTLGTNNAGVTINTGGTLKSTANIANSGFGANPVTINAGGILDLTRGSVPNGTTTTPAGVTLANNFSGAGDIVLRGVNDSVPTSPNSFFSNAFGNYTLNGNSQNFSGRFVMDNARLAADNVNGPNTIDELGSATLEIAAGGQVVLGGGTVAGPGLVNGASGYHDNNVFRIAGTGWASDNAPATQQGAIRFNANNARIASNSSIVLTGDAQIANLNLTNFIDAPISEVGGARVLTIGTLNANNNANLSLDGNNTYSGGTNIESTSVLVNSSTAFGTGAVNVNGYTNARATLISIGNNVNVGNAINLSSFAGTGGSRGAIEGGTTNQIAALGGAGVGTVSGPININAPGNQVNNWAHFSAGQGINSALNVTGPVTVASPGNTTVQARSQNSGGYVQFSGGGNYTAFDLALGTVRLGANNGLASGTSIATRRLADAAATGGGTARGIFDMNGFNQTVSAVTRTGTLTTANFSLVNTNAATSTLTITGALNSDIQEIPGAPESAGAINIVKNGTGALVLSGDVGRLGNTGNYQINGGTFSASAANQTIGGSVTVNAGGTYAVAGTAGTQTVTGPVNVSGGVLSVASGATLAAGVDVSAGGTVTGTGTVSGNVVSAGGFNFAPGSSPGALTYGSNVTLSGAGGFQWEINDANGTAGTLLAGYDVINVGGNLDLTGLTNMNIDIVGLTSGNLVGAVPNFNPTSSYAWTLFDVAGTTSGFDAADFTPSFLANFEPNNPTIPSSGVFSVSQVGNDIVLNYSAVPEPSSILLIVTGLGVSMMTRRRRKQETLS